ncbi:hypothetical protein, partial [Pseudomonas silesiensis]|uniref:hypothetical protein n=1 Tax=Pseudomonas silesiensis TaxID=1853130 RepID=UPI0034D57E57
AKTISSLAATMKTPSPASRLLQGSCPPTFSHRPANAFQQHRKSRVVVVLDDVTQMQRYKPEWKAVKPRF